MRVDVEQLYARITRVWYVWAEEHGQVPVWPPRHGSQTHHMALGAVGVLNEVVKEIEGDVLEDVATFIRMQKKRHRKSSALLDSLAEALEDGTWENL